MKCVAVLLLLAAVAQARTVNIYLGCKRAGISGCMSNTVYCNNGKVVKCRGNRSVCINNKGCVKLPTPPEPPILGGSQVTVKAINATKYVVGAVTPFPDISKCPKGFHKNKNDNEVVIGRAVIDAFFVQIAQPQMKTLYPAYYCAQGALFDNGKPVTGILYTAAAQRPAHYSGQDALGPEGTCLRPRHYQLLLQGRQEEDPAQRGDAYYCNGGEIERCKYGPCSPTKGCPSKSGGGLGGSNVIKVKALPSKKSSYKEIKYKPGKGKRFPSIKCPKGFRREKTDQDYVIGRAVVDAYFLQIAEPQLERQGSKYGCKKGAYFDNGKKIKGVLYASAAERPPHYDVTTCIQEKVPAGKKAIAYAQGVVNYYCSVECRRRPGCSFQCAQPHSRHKCRHRPGWHLSEPFPGPPSLLHGARRAPTPAGARPGRCRLAAAPGPSPAFHPDSSFPPPRHTCLAPLRSQFGSVSPLPLDP